LLSNNRTPDFDDFRARYCAKTQTILSLTHNVIHHQLLLIFMQMNAKRLFFYCIVSFLGVMQSLAQYPFGFEDQIYDPDVKTVLLHPENEPLQDPVIFIGDEDKLQLSFDLLGNDSPVLYFSLQHCNHDWTPSQLRKNEFQQGFEEGEIRDYQYSVNTLTPYVHYRLLFPDDQLKPIISGNYLMIVYENRMSEGNILFTKRFFLVDNLAKIQMSIPTYPRNLEYTQSKHQIDVAVFHGSLYLLSPEQSLNLSLRQNGRWDNMVTGLKPNYNLGDKLTYEYAEETVFEGGNQYRSFDIKNFRYQSERIRRVFQDTDYYVVQLWPDQPRTRKNYINEPDIRGKRLTKAREDQITETEGDYSWVEFLLEYPAPFTHEEVHIIGALTNWNIDKSSRMQYNYALKAYEASLFLKQGYYNYLYGLVEQGSSKAEVAFFEGDHRETINEYAAYLYYKRPGTDYDQLVGYSLILSR
jgi:hypothetical protein